MTWFVMPEMHTPAKRRYFRRLIPGTVARSDRIIAISESCRQDLVGVLGTPPEKITVIHLGVEGRFRPGADPAAAARLRERYGLASRVILFTGQIHPRKNVAALIRAFAAVSELGEEWCLVLAGEFAWDCRAERALARATPGVVFAGFVPDEDLPALYGLADIVAYPSLYEGFGLPVVEAMASGVPVITSNISAMPEVAGDAALLVDPRSEAEIAGALRRLAGDAALRAELGGRGIVRARQFSWQRAARATRAVYEQAAGAG